MIVIKYIRGSNVAYSTSISKIQSRLVRIIVHDRRIERVGLENKWSCEYVEMRNGTPVTDHWVKFAVLSERDAFTWLTN